MTTFGSAPTYSIIIQYEPPASVGGEER
jgi:hypothetical protein